MFHGTNAEGWTISGGLLRPCRFQIWTDGIKFSNKHLYLLNHCFESESVSHWKSQDHSFPTWSTPSAGVTCSCFYMGAEDPNSELHGYTTAFINWICFSFSRQSHCIAKASLQLQIFLPQCLKCWDYGMEPPSPLYTCLRLEGWGSSFVLQHLRCIPKAQFYSQLPEFVSN